MTVFIDTGAWIAIADTNDQYSGEAGKLYTDLIIRRLPLVTSDLVLVEIYNLLLRTIGIMPTINFANGLRTIPFLRILPVTSGDWEKAWKILEKYDDKDFSFTDCTSFAVMDRLRIKTAFTFDAHFIQYGYNRIS